MQLKLLAQMHKELSETFPFFEKKQNFQNGMGQHQQYHNQNQNPNTQNYNQQNPYNSNNQHHSSHGSHHQPYHNQSSPFNSQNNNPPVNPLASNNSMQGQNMGSQKQQMENPKNMNDSQQIQMRLKNELDATVKGILDEFNEEKKTCDQLYNLKQKLDENEASINQLEEDLKEKINYINQQITIHKQFISQNDQVTLNKDNVLNYIKEQTPIQTQILEISAEQEAIKETVAYAEDMFKQKRIDFETYIKQVSEHAEKEFSNKLLIKKCINKSKM